MYHNVIDSKKIIDVNEVFITKRYSYINNNIFQLLLTGELCGKSEHKLNRFVISTFLKQNMLFHRLEHLCPYIFATPNL